MLLLDEPTANLDPISASRIEELITNIIRQHNTTIIMATHDMSYGQRLADRIGVLINGEIIQTGRGGEVFTMPQSRAVAEFVGVENIIDGVTITNEDGIATIDVGGINIEVISDYSVGEKVSVCIRPEDITLHLAQSTSSARNSFTGEVTRVTSFGPLTRVVIDCGTWLVALITKKSAEELDLKNGRRIYASFKATAVHTIRREGN